MSSEVSRRYAKALYEVAASANRADKVYLELSALDQAMSSNGEALEFILSPTTPTDSKIAALKAATNSFSEEVKNLVFLLIEKKRSYLFSEIVKSYRDISDASLGKTRGVVRSAVKLNDDEKKQLEIKISKATKREVILTFEEDKSLMGGLIAQVGGWTFDDSLESHLTRIGEDLHRRTN